MEFISALSSWCSGSGFGHGAGYGMSGMSGWMPFHFGGILQLVVIGLIIYFTVRMFRKPDTGPSAPSAQDILKRRYASGEIDEETYIRMKNELK
ncbi:SHOCT domain-containing protein [Maridesulfovibrio salexigens]|uniref:SHOCT domain-containing protein n=1 Tax=Maridesulfovibrio salexigens (strain ATCC 14822 / DSM 2638 / NCIMB 8403 / VKM B-1763) TaxID=526222 RepID=C6C1U1_MARSD|nr:SHOCT domain-containing protein [Maridesulfovibrio salexigens]ACS79337.1 conserved hypothetical protein [Maridesulfovibrio salexigens DSM 2638]